MARPAEYLLATTSSGATWPDPSDDMLFMLFEDILAGDEEFFAVERVSDPTGQTFAQTIRCLGDQSDCLHSDELWRVERREGTPCDHWFTELSSHREAFAVLANWAFGQVPSGSQLPEHTWHLLTFDETN